MSNQVYTPPIPNLPAPPIGYGPFRQSLDSNKLIIYFDNPFGTAFKMTVGALVALTVWSVFWFMLWVVLLSALVGTS